MRGSNVILATVSVLALVAWDSADSKDLPFGSRLGVRRVKAKSQPVLIDWAQFGGFGREEKSLSQSQTDTENVRRPGQFFPIFPRASEIKLDIDPPVTQLYEAPPVDSIETPVISSFSVDPVITPIFPTSSSTAPVSTGRKCRKVTETLEDQVEETQCEVVTTNSCADSVITPDPASCYSTTDTECKDETVSELKVVCRENIVTDCESEVKDLTKNDCRTVKEEKCESGYLTELKEECQYETVYETVCSLGYLVSYREQCDGRNCQNIPQLQQNQCREVPRVEEQCKNVPVKRPNNICSPVERVICKEVPRQQLIEKCVYIDKPICNAEPVEVLKNICSRVETSICTRDCQTISQNVCQTVLVPKTRVVETEICDQDDANNFFFNDLERSNF